MNELFEQLGINWKLFLSQLVNFFILLFVLRAFVYKPFLAIIKERSKKIKEGLNQVLLEYTHEDYDSSRSYFDSDFNADSLITDYVLVS